MVASRPVISSKEGVSTGFLTGQGPIYDKADTLLEKYRSQTHDSTGGLTPEKQKRLAESRIKI